MDDVSKWTGPFLDALERTASVRDACAAIGVSRSTAYRHRRRCPEFARAWDEALELPIRILEDEALERALDRADPASARLLMFLLKARKPEVYGERSRTAEPAVDLAALVERAERAAARLGYAVEPAPALQPGDHPVPK
jgi:hypothetical protein